jgi:hypothetical protein
MNKIIDEPQQALDELRVAVAVAESLSDDGALSEALHEVITRFNALDEHLMAGGSWPQQWYESSYVAEIETD